MSLTGIRVLQRELAWIHEEGTWNGYDSNGNLTSDSNGTVITYNATDQSTSMQSNSSHTETTTYTGTSQAERVAVNTTTDLYTSLGLSRETNASGSTEYVRCSCGLLNSLHTPDGKKYYYLFDGQGSIVTVTDSAGNAVDEYQYNAWGEILSSTVGVAQPWIYAGGYLDAATGKYKFGIRYYSSTEDRWTQATPIGGSLQEVTKANPYEYAGDDPANAIDPSGGFYIEVKYTLYTFDGIPTGVDIHSIYLELTNADLGNIADLVTTAINYISQPIQTFVPILGSYFITKLNNLIKGAITSCADLYIAYYSFDTNSGYQNCI